MRKLSNAKNYIYRNTSKRGPVRPFGSYQWSCKRRGLVWTSEGGHDWLVGFDVSFRVSEKSRQRVLATGSKNVHAYAVCDSVWNCPPERVDGLTFDDISNARPISYNPKVGPYFTDSNGYPLKSARAVIASPAGMLAVDPVFHKEVSK